MITGEQLNKNLQTFLRHIDAIRDTLPMTLLLINPYNKKANDDFVTFLEKNAKEIEDDNGKKSIHVKSEHVKVFESLEKNASISSLASKIIPESLFVSLISQYDAFLTRLLRAVFQIRPDILNGSERNLTFTQLVELQTIQDAREFIIDKEVETVLRKSYSEQFEYLEKLLALKLRENLPIWQTFIEITERRNLLVHCDGIISSQYIKICKDHKCSITGVKIGDRLGVQADYFQAAYKCLYEVSVKLTHTLWRKLLNNDLKSADRKLNDICYDLIDTRTFDLADILLKFGYDQHKHYDESTKNVFIINGALSQYLQKNKDECIKIISKKDWSASSDDFKLANEILRDNYENAYYLMKKIGQNGDVDKSDYREWPLFNEIRTTQAFKETFKDIFDEEYSISETPKRPLQELITKVLRKNVDLKNKIVKKEESAKVRREKEANITEAKSQKIN